MTTLLFSVIAATSLAAAAIGAPGETRSAQSLPSEHLVVAPANPAATGKLHTTNRLVDAASDGSEAGMSDEMKCEKHGGHWDDKKLRCRRGLAWEVPVIGAGTIAGIIYAISSGDGPTSSTPISH